MSPPLQFQDDDTRMSHPLAIMVQLLEGSTTDMHCTQAFSLSWRLRRGTISDLRGRLFGTIPVKLYGRWGNLSKYLHIQRNFTSVRGSISQPGQEFIYPYQRSLATTFSKRPMRYSQTSFGDNRLTRNFLYIYLVTINRVLYFAFTFFVFALLAYQFEPARPLYFGLFGLDGLCRGSGTQIK